MLSTFPPAFSGDSLLGNPFPPLGPGFPFLFHLPEEQPVFSPSLSQEPVNSNSGSYALNPAPSPGSDNSSRSEPKTLNSDDESRDKFKNKRCGCDESDGVVDERKRRRMLSNRESARRSRMRKQKHLENLRNQANRLKLGNREQTNRLRFIVHQTQLFRRENEYLRAEAAVLRHRLSDIRQLLVVHQLLNITPMQNNIPTI